MRCSLAFVMFASCLHSPPYAGDDTVGPGDAGIFMDAPVDGNYSCPGGQSFGVSTVLAPLAPLTPPDCANRMTIDAYGAAGGAARTGPGGNGGHLKIAISILPGMMWYVAVGEAGGNVIDPSGGAGGHFGGGDGGRAGGGGGETDVRTTMALGSRILVVGAGGGGSMCEDGTNVGGGDGGSDTAGLPGSCATNVLPTPGGQMPQGAGLCPGAAGGSGQGGQGCSDSSDGGGGGGGAGFYGGGGGRGTGGAGGSSYVDHTLSPTMIMNTRGGNSNDGHVSVTWTHVGINP